MKKYKIFQSNIIHVPIPKWSKNKMHISSVDQGFDWNSPNCLFIVCVVTTVFHLTLDLKLTFCSQVINFLNKIYKEISIHVIINTSYEGNCVKFERKKTTHSFYSTFKYCLFIITKYYFWRFLYMITRLKDPVQLSI